MAKSDTINVKGTAVTIISQGETDFFSLPDMTSNFNEGRKHYQGSFAFIHNYEQRLDSSSDILNGVRKTKSTNLPNLEGTNFYQWQAMIPLGIEYAVYQNKLSIRLEGDFGIVGSRYRSKKFASMEAHGAGISFIYRPENKSEAKRNQGKN